MTVQDSFQSEVGQQAMREFVERMQDPLQAIEDVRIEDEANCTIGAGSPFNTATDESTTNARGNRQQLRILVTGEFCQLLTDCDLGAGLPDAMRVGRQLLAQRLKQPSNDIQQQLTAALAEAMAPDKAQDGIPDSARAKVRIALYSLLSEQDWDEISIAATTAIKQRLKQKASWTEKDLQSVA